MKEDDYDPNAFYNLTHKAKKIEKVIGHGYTGRHNDNSPAIVRWFLTEYSHVLNEIRNGGNEWIIKKYIIYWNRHDFYNYGSQVAFHHNSVSFKNELMSPGKKNCWLGNFL